MVKVRKSKKGNSMLLLIAMVAIITILGGSLTVAIATTSKQNNRVKVDEDLFYAAESGIESGYYKIKSAPASTPLGNSNYNIGNFSSEGITVNVDIVKDASNTFYTVTSTANKIDTGKSKILKGKVNLTKVTVPAEGENFFKYSLISNKIKIITGKENNAFDSQVANIAHTMGSEYFKAVENTTGYYTDELGIKYNLIPQTGVVDSIRAFNMPEMKFDNKPGTGTPENEKIKVTSLIELDNKAKEPIANKSGVRKIKYDNKYTIYLVNTEELKIIVPAMSINNTLIICSGKITIKYNSITSMPAIILTNSSVVANEVEIYGSSFNLSRPTFGHQFATLTQNDIDNILDKINMSGLIDNISGDVGHEVDSWLIGDIEIEY